jgi:hypothetical protein
MWSGTVAPLLIIFLAVADADGEPARVMLETAAQAFGGDMRIAVERFEGSPPTLAALASVAKTRGATATARVLWREAGGAQVSLDVYLARNDRLTYRGLTFGAQDLAAERGRAIGLVLAALILAPEESRLAPLEQPPPTPGTPPKAIATAPVESPRPKDEMTAASSGTQAAASARGPGQLAPPPLGRWAVEALTAAGVALGGAGGGLGGALAVRQLAGARWGARLALQARTGSVPAAQSSSVAAGLAAGLFATLRPVGPATPQWNLGARLDVILGYEMLTHFSDDDPSPVRRGRFLPLAAAWLEGDWRIAPTATLHAAMGMEIASGTTQVIVRDVDVARLPLFRAVGEAGVRLRF